VLVPEIDRLGGGFAASRSMGADGSAIFVGELGEVLAIAPSGEMFRGTYMTAMNFATNIPNYANMTKIH
jgi:hypothetical protein